MKSVIIQVDGVLSDSRQRQPLSGTPEYFGNDALAKDAPIPGSQRCLQEIVRQYNIVYLSARPEEARKASEDWLNSMHFPKGSLLLGMTAEEQKALAPNLNEQADLTYGIGLEGSMPELFGALKCESIPVKEFEPDWNLVRSRVMEYEYTALQAAIELLSPYRLKMTEPGPYRVDIYIEAANLQKAVKTLADAHWGFLSAITGIDDAATDELEILYHFANKFVILSLRVRIPHEKASIPSICAIKPGATFFERELSEMFGVEVVGTPDPSRLFLPDEWPEGVYPLRKDFVVPPVNENQD